MAILQIPTSTTDDLYKVAVTLEGQDYVFTFAWNYRSSVWEMTIDGVVSSVPVLIGVNLLASVPLSTRPPGTLLAVDSSNQDLDPGLNDLGDRVSLLYEESGS